MTKNGNKYFNNYLLLRNEIEKHSEKLAEKHSKHMQCKKSCDMCCIDYSIFPIEFHFILNNLKENKIAFEGIKAAKENVCAFLKNHICTIYEQRPIICRTHGLPLLYMNDSSEWELSACELNFTEFDFENFTFENTYPQDKYNSKLFMLNKEFIGDFPDKEYEDMELIPIKNLIQYL